MESPCKDCLTYPICLGIFNRDQNKIFQMNLLVEKCLYLYKYIALLINIELHEDENREYILIPHYSFSSKETTML